MVKKSINKRPHTVPPSTFGRSLSAVKLLFSGEIEEKPHKSVGTTSLRFNIRTRNLLNTTAQQQFATVDRLHVKVGQLRSLKRELLHITKYRKCGKDGKHEFITKTVG